MTSQWICHEGATVELVLWRKWWTRGDSGQGRRSWQDCGLALLDLFTREWRSMQEWIAAKQPLYPLHGV